MTELKKLLIEFDTLTQKNRGLSLSKQIDLLEQSLQSKYSVTLRNSNSSADNTSVEQLHSDEELMSKIEDMALDMANYFVELVYISMEKRTDIKKRETDKFTEFKQELKSLFQTHRNTISTAVKQKDDNLVDEDELRSKIKSVICNKVDYCNDAGWSGRNEATEEIVKLFKTNQNSVLRQANNLDEQSIIK